INGTLQGGGDLPRSFILGRTATAGSLVWANTWGKDGDTPNGYLTQVIALSDLPIKGLIRLWVNNEPVTISSKVDEFGSVVTEYLKDGKPNLWIRFYDGTQTQADGLLVSKASNGNRYWSATRVGRGIAYVVITARVSKNMFSGIPSFKFELDGMRLYDPSKDSTNGGNGSHRQADRSTWGGDGDYLPAVQAYNLLRGLAYDGKWFYGVQGMSAARLPSANWIAAINKCRKPVASAEGMVPQYRSGGEVTIDAALSIALEAINATCQGRIAEIGGIYQMFLGAPEASVIHFDDDDILSTEEQSFTPFFGLADSINGIIATYPSPADGWAVKTAPPIHRTDLEARHGNRRLMASVELAFVSYAEQVQRLMSSALLEGQRARRHTIVLPPRFWAYATPGTIFAWTSKRNGYVNKLMRVDGVADRTNLDVMVDLTEVDPTDYDWDSGKDFKPPVDGTIGSMRPQPQPIIDFSAIPSVSKDANGNDRRPAVLLSWDGDKADVDLVRFELRQTWDLAVIYTGRTEDVGRGSMLIAPFMLQANSQYQVRARYAVYDDYREFIWSDWISVRMLDVRLSELDIYPVGVNELREEVEVQLKWLGNSESYAWDELERLGQLTAEQDAGNFAERRVLREEVTVAVNDVTASYKKAIQVVVNDVGAVVTRIEELEVSVDESIARATSSLQTEINKVGDKVDVNARAITALTTTIDEDVSRVITLMETEINKVDGKVDANSKLITALSTTVDNVSAGINIRSETEVSPGGGRAIHGVQVKIGSGDVWSSSAYWIEVVNGVSSFMVAADRFVVTDSTGTSKQPMVYTEGELTLAIANIGEVTAGIIRSADNKFVIDLAAGSLRISD
ncbi:phage tail protein, partial [Paenochrobactrum sp. BZR 201-1]